MHRGQPLPCAVGGAAVDHDDLGRRRLLGEQARNHAANILGLIQNRGHNAHRLHARSIATAERSSGLSLFYRQAPIRCR